MKAGVINGIDFDERILLAQIRVEMLIDAKFIFRKYETGKQDIDQYKELMGIKTRDNKIVNKIAIE